MPRGSWLSQQGCAFDSVAVGVGLAACLRRVTLAGHASAVSMSTFEEAPPSAPFLAMDRGGSTAWCPLASPPFTDLAGVSGGEMLQALATTPALGDAVANH